jgi:hypothetical protein
MHPEVTGKQGEECSKCGMELTEPVAQTEAVSEEEKQKKLLQPIFCYQMLM